MDALSNTVQKKDIKKWLLNSNSQKKKAYYFSFDEPFNFSINKTEPTLKLNLSQKITHLSKKNFSLEQIETILKECDASKRINPDWVLQQIEQLAIDLPLPSKPIQSNNRIL